MLIYENENNETCIYIHIPKNSGKYIRKNIENNQKNKIIKYYWGLDNKNYIDLAHIPYLLKDNYYTTNDKTIYYAHSRNPYDRIISAYFYVNHMKLGNNNSISDFKLFIKNILKTLNFDNKYSLDIIHYYPQYMFICDKNENIDNVKITKLQDVDGLNIRTYDLSKYYDATLLQIVNKVYKKDFVILNYEIKTKI